VNGKFLLKRFKQYNSTTVKFFFVSFRSANGRNKLSWFV